MSALLERLNEDMGDVVERAGQSLVRVSAGGRGFGAGSIWHSDGLIITNAHVVSGAGGGRRAGDDLTVTLPDGSTHPARLLAQDTAQDLAALSIEVTGDITGEAGGLTPVELGDSRGLEPGQWLMALGHPWGVAGAATGGAVIGWGADLPETESSVEGREWIAVGLCLRPGHSGGPLVDAQGRLVGICAMMAGPQVGMAVPVHTAKEFLRRELGTRG
ncbi:MAG: trypsin-like peptidase domain-containing protein [Chloroflexi bacterium]|nr:trypsin-like peptidase domain-containing protein [Chloroflexota bacterium]